MKLIKYMIAGVAAAAMLSATTAANASSILFAQVNSVGSYVPEGNDLASMLTDAGHSVTTVFLNQSVISDFTPYDQVWVYDLSSSADNGANQVQNYTNIAGWYNGLADKNLILDGRILSSSDRWTSCTIGLGCPGSAMQQEDAWIQNFAAQLDARNGGLVLGTDHAPAFTRGINEINAAIAIDDFTGFYASTPFQATVDPLSPLFISSLETCGYGAVVTTDKCINDNSSTSFVPTGVQPNGQELTPVAWHGTVSTARTNAAVSSTIGSATFGTCGGPNQEPCVSVPEPSVILLLGFGLAGMALTRRRRREA